MINRFRQSRALLFRMEMTLFKSLHTSNIIKQPNFLGAASAKFKPAGALIYILHTCHQESNLFDGLVPLVSKVTTTINIGCHIFGLLVGSVKRTNIVLKFK
jgi:hypothetical protein